MSTFSYTPDYSAKKVMKPRVNKISFGDGYSERVGDGLNTKMETWNLSFKRAPSVINSMDSFLLARGGVEAFHWTTPAGRDAVFYCEEWEASYDSPGWSVLTATFIETPEVVSP